MATSELDPNKKSPQIIPDDASPELTEILNLIGVRTVLTDTARNAKESIAKVKKNVSQDNTPQQRRQLAQQVTEIGDQAIEVFDAIEHSLSQEKLESLDQTQQDE